MRVPEDADLVLRPVCEEDSELLFDIYASARHPELTALDWPEEQQTAFLRMQFTARASAYGLQFPAAEYLIIEAEGEAVGSIIIERRREELRLADIAILPQYRRRGIASRVVARLMGEGSTITLHVDKGNVPARSFYEKLGFAVAGGTEVVDRLEWKPSGK